jgi:hypothetical protein
LPDGADRQDASRAVPVDPSDEGPTGLLARVHGCATPRDVNIAEILIGATAAGLGKIGVHGHFADRCSRGRLIVCIHIAVVI